MATLTVTYPQAHGGQRAIREAMRGKRSAFVACGRRWHKTTECAVRATRRAVRHGETIVWGAPTYKQVRIGWNEAKRMAPWGNFRESVMEATFPGTKGRIIFRSLDNPDNARGETAHGIIIDEAADVKETAYYDVLQPMLLTTQGWAWICGTPKGMNWFWRECMACKDDPLSVFFQAPTLGARITPDGLIREPHPFENPDIPFADLVRLYRRMPERSFRQEIMAEFLEDAGGVFRNVTSRAIVSPWPVPLYNGNFVMGADWGRTNDYTVLTVMDARTGRVVDMERFTGISFALQMQRFYALWEKWFRPVVTAELNSFGRPLVEDMQRKGVMVIPFDTTNATKAAAIENLALCIEQGRISYPADDTLIAELQAYQQERLPSGAIRYSAPEGMHDDMVISLALAAWSCQRGGGSFTYNYIEDADSPEETEPGLMLGGTPLHLGYTYED